MPTMTVEESLVELGYQLKDYGSHWKCNAIYRGGDNRTALMIYKDTGVWRDFVNNTPPSSFRKLVQLTLNTTDSEIINRYLQDSKKQAEVYEKKEILEMEKIYPEDCLKKLFPNYSIYEQKGISQETQQMYKCGLASAGKMYRRIVFPIYNEDGQIFGFSGRKVDEESEAPKWKHIGAKSLWIYPAMIPGFPQIEDEVIIVESVGDSMALTENGLPNNLTTFGLDLSPKLLNYLISKDLNSIIIATNNDSKSSVNRGLLAAIKIMMKLSVFFDLELIKIKLPLANDFSDMQKDCQDFQEWCDSPAMSNQEILSFIEANKREFNTKVMLKFLNKIS